MVDIPGTSRLGRWLRIDIPEIWLRFLIALVGLTLALTAALFSTVSRESGNLWATLILASTSLLLAVVVGVTTVPYLAKRVAGATKLREALDYEVTRVGVVYVVVILLIGIAAMNTGNNLLYIIVAAMLAAILVSGFASALVLNKLELEVLIPATSFAGSVVTGRIEIRNRRRWFPAFSINVVSAKEPKLRRRWHWVRTTFTFPPIRPGRQQWLQLPDRRLKRTLDEAPPPRIFKGSAYFPYIKPRGTVSAELNLTFPRRGRYEQDSFGLATRFPFAFLTKTRWVKLKRDLLVFPPVERSPQFFEVLPLIAGQVESLMRGRGHDLHGIREYMPEDSARHVDWKATAKSGALKVREFSREDERRIRLIFDNPTPGSVSTDAYEKAVNLAASLAWHFSAQNAKTSYVMLDHHGSNVYEFLSLLAEIQPEGRISVLDSLDESHDFSVILTSRSREMIPPQLLKLSHLLQMSTDGAVEV